jgi:hypothetical protein
MQFQFTGYDEAGKVIISSEGSSLADIKLNSSALDVDALYVHNTYSGRYEHRYYIAMSLSHLHDQEPVDRWKTRLWVSTSEDVFSRHLNHSGYLASQTLLATA